MQQRWWWKGKLRGHDFLLPNEIENTSTNFINRLKKIGIDQIVVGQSHNKPIKTFTNVYKIISEFNPVAVQTNFINPLGIPLLWFLRVPLIYYTAHSGIIFPVSLKSKIIRKINSKFSTRIFTVSERVRKDEILAGCDSRKTMTMYLGLPIKDFLSENTFYENYPKGWDDPQKKIIITVGRFFPEKGMRYVVQAAIDVLRQKKDVFWWLVGNDGPESEICRKLVNDFEMQDNIIFLGQRNDVAALMNKSYLQVVGSLSEGLGLMALEASASGVPTVGPNMPGLNEAIINGVTGVLVKPQSSDDLASATLKLIDDPILREKYSENGKKFVNDKFDSEKLIDKLLSLIEKDYDYYYINNLR